MPSNAEIKQAIAQASKLVPNPTPELIKALGGVDAMLDEKDKDDKAIEAALAQTREDYRKAILEAPLPPTNKVEEKGTAEPKAKSFEEALKEAGDTLAKGNK